MGVKEQAKHTPGPWRTDGFHGRIEKITPQEDSGVCVAVMPMWEAEYEAEKNANARLIAESPELLQVLKDIIEGFFAEYEDPNNLPDGPTTGAITRAQYIIAKVEGRS